MNERIPELWAKAQQLAARGYTTIISEDTLSNGDRVYLVEHPELPGCMTQGKSLDDAMNDLKEVTVHFIYYLLEDGLDVPNPISSKTVTGGSGSKAQLVDFEPVMIFSPEVEKPSADKEEILEDLTQAEHRKTIMRFSVVEGNLT